MPILLSDEEIDAMEGLPHLHCCLYIFGIRKHMDYATAITGIKRKISYKSLSEEVYVVPQRGFMDTGYRSREAIRRAIKILEKAGLIAIKSSDKNLILECVLAKSDKSVQNKPDRRPTPQADTKADTQKTQKTTGNTVWRQDKPDTEADIPKNTKPDTHPVSGIYTNLTNLVRVNSQSYPQTLRQAFYDALKDRNFGMDGMMDPRTGAMLTVWEGKGVTTEDMKIGMDFADAKNDGTPRYPMYYKAFVLSAMKARLEAQAEIEKPIEVNHARRKPSKPESSVHRVLRRLEEIASTQGEDEDDEQFIS